MATFIFRATPQKRTWLHQKAIVRETPLKGGKQARIIDPVILKDGDSVEAEGAIAHIMRTRTGTKEYFEEKVAPSPKPKTTPSPKKESDE